MNEEARRLEESRTGRRDWKLGTVSQPASLGHRARRLFGTWQLLGGFPARSRAIARYVMAGARHAINPQQYGTKAAARYRLSIPPGQSAALKLRLADRAFTRAADETDEQAFGATIDELSTLRSQPRAALIQSPLLERGSRMPARRDR
jgi:hypothetical protein